MLKRATVLLVVLCVSGVAVATDYNYVGGGTVTITAGPDYETQFNDTANWDGSLTIPTTLTDNFHISTYGPGPTYMTPDNEVYLPSPGAGNTLYFGSIVVDNGAIYLPSGAAGTYKFSGSFVKNDVAGGADARFEGTPTDVTFDLGGDFLLDSHVNTGRCTTGVKYMTILMRGGSATYKVYQYSESAHQTKQVIVDNGASVNFAGTTGYHNLMKNLEVWGTATGRVQHALTATEWAPDVGGDTTGLDVVIGPGSSRGMLMQGHFQDVSLTAGSWMSSNGNFVAALPGNLHVRNLDIATGTTGGGGIVTYMVDTDNLNFGTSNLTVDENLKIGYSSSGRSYIGILKANSSTIDVGGDVLVRYGVASGVGSHILGGSAAFFVGGDWIVSDPTKSSPSWDMGTSTVTFDGSGTQIVDAGMLVPFHSVVLNQTGSTLQLNDNMVLTGDLTFLSASTVLIPNELNAIIFKGGIDNEADAQLIDVGGADLINVTIAVLNPPSYVKLMSDLLVSDNLNIAAGCKLFLNGYTLNAEGQEITTSMAWDQGEIVGSGVIPEPATLLLLGTGILGALGVARRRRMR